MHDFIYLLIQLSLHIDNILRKISAQHFKITYMDYIY